ncbi:MAG: sugar phosphate isomerase/epimerase [Candidatus Poribacteria bacterium]|nr:sugar phosphate isomerase/epimerase [Candidatus Poribacteria bacterium]
MTFRLGVLTDEISQDLVEAIEIAKRWGIENIELHGVWGKNVCHLNDAELSDVLRIVRRSGMPVTCIDSLTLRCDLDNDDEYAEHIAHMKRSIEIAPLFGTNLVRLFSFWKIADPTDDTWERIWSKLELPVRLAEREGIVLGFENVSSGNIGTSADLERLFAEFDSPALQLIWDPANACASGDERSALEGYRAVKDRVVHVHVKDIDFINGERTWLPIGQGRVDYPPFFRELKADGYDGVVALETHYRPANGSSIDGSEASFKGLLAELATL